MPTFIPLHIHTGYSFLESGILLERLFDVAQKYNYAYLGITDFDVMYGIPEFNALAKKNNIKPIFGVDLKVDENRISLFVKNEIGYKNLTRIIAIKNKEKLDQFPLKLSDIKEFSEGLICVVPTEENDFFNSINDNTKDKMFEFCKVFENIFIGISEYKIENNDHVKLIMEFAKEYSYSTLPFPNILYLNKDEAIVLDILDAIKRNTTIEEDITPTHNKEYLKNIHEYTEFYPLETQIVFDDFLRLIDFDFDTKRGELINFVENENPKDIFIEKIKEGAKIRGIDLTVPVYKNRLNHEYKVIKNLGYINYFLVVQDYINFAKTNNIPIGPGRGSAAGSLISYCLQITDVDPIKYNLLFERFLNEKRNSMPDIDVDISDIKREEIIKYLIQKYGSNRVARVCAYQTIAAKQALRDTCRAFGKPKEFIDLLSKTIPSNFKGNDQSLNFSLDYARENIPAFNEILKTPDFEFIFNKAHLIEGLPRQRGLHAAGVILNETDLRDCMPLDFDAPSFSVTQYEKDYLENQGFLKMDLLGLSNLTVIEKCLEKIKETRQISIKMEEIPYEDSLIFDLIKDGRTMGIFQLDTAAANNAITNIKPDNFLDVVATISLDRPGPMQFIPSYSRRKHGRERITYLNNVLEPILKETYGIIVYQEQIMQIAQVYAGFDFAEADIFRRAISKKHEDELLKLKDSFIKGSVKKGHNPYEAEKLFEQIHKFANYGFNKSHAVSYAMIACKEGYLKAHYPIEFYASILDQQYGANDVKFSKYLAEIKKAKIKVLLPNINESTYQFELYENGLLMPLLGIGGLQSKVVFNIIKERQEHGKFKSFIDFVVRMSSTIEGITDNQLSKIIDAGAFDSLEPNRKSLKMSVPNAIQYASTCIYQEGLLLNDFGLSFKLIDAYDDPIDRMNNEMNALGVMISDSPFNHLPSSLKDVKRTPITDLKYRENSTVIAIVRAIKVINVKQGKDKGAPMAFVTIFDDTGDIDCTIFSNLFAEIQIDLKKDNLIHITGYKEERNGRDNFVVNTCKIVTE